MAILSELQRRGISVTADGDALVLKPRRAVDSELLARVRQHKPEIIRALSARPATCSTSCYEVERGKWIHRPWTGCCTPMPPQTERREVEAVCWHCGGERRCACSTCALEERGRPAGPCAACRGTGKAMQWIQ